MLIRETFATAIHERIQPVVKVADRKPAVVYDELANLVITPQWELHIRTGLDAYVNAADSDDEQGIGFWISGFFGSGKSLQMKVLGALLEGGEVLGHSIHDIFLSRVPVTSAERARIQRLLAACQLKVSTTAIGGNLFSQTSSSDEPLVLAAFKFVAAARGYTQHWPLAWAVEYQIDARGLQEDFHRRAEQLCDKPWLRIARDPEFYFDRLCQAAADVLPTDFADASGVARSAAAADKNRITPDALIKRLRDWCEDRDAAGRRHKVLLQLDEVGQWISAGNLNDRTMQVQGLVEAAATHGGGRVWVAVTAHGDIQSLRQNVQQEAYAKILKRFDVRCALSNEDIGMVVEERLLRKSQTGRVELMKLFDGHSGSLADAGNLQRTKRVYPVPDAQSFALHYPYLPWTVSVVPDVVKGIAQSTGRDDALTGSNRTMIGVIQGGILDRTGFLDAPVGKLLCLADLYDQVAGDAPIEIKTDINTIEKRVSGASAFTTRVAQALYMLGRAEYIPTTGENVARAIFDSVDSDLAALRSRVVDELERLVASGYAKHVGDEYAFLTTQQRGFQDKVRERQETLASQSYELSQKLKDYDSEDALRFDRVQLHGREVTLRLEIDGRAVRNPSAAVTLRVASPIQRAIDPEVANDDAMRQRSLQDKNTILLRMADVPWFRHTLSLAVATSEVADEVIPSASASEAEKDVARQAKQTDAATHKSSVRRLLSQAVRGSTIFYQGTAYQLPAAESASEAVRAALATILPSVYPRLAEVPHRVTNEDAAVKAALSGQHTNADLQALGVYHADGTLNEGHPLISTLRGCLPLENSDEKAVSTDALRTQFERPPYGWDGNSVKVGLALLLRASTCRLIENGKVLADPANRDVADALSKDARFKSLRAQGVQTDIPPTEMKRIRDLVEAVFGVKSSLVATTLSNELGRKLAETQDRAREIETWAETAQCPLPTNFVRGSAIVAELTSTAVPSVRLPRFAAEADTLRAYVGCLDSLDEFRRNHGATFLRLRDFYTAMAHAGTGIPEVETFVNDWKTVIEERSVTTPIRWNEVIAACDGAKQALEQQVRIWMEDAGKRLKGLEDGLAQRVRGADVPDDRIPAETGALAAALGIQDLSNRVANSSANFAEARGLHSALTAAELNADGLVRELADRYRSAEDTMPDIDSGPASGAVRRLRLRDILPRTRIQRNEDIDDILTVLRAALESEVALKHVVELEC